MKKFGIAISVLTLVVIVGLFVKRGENIEEQQSELAVKEEVLKPQAKAALEKAQEAMGQPIDKVEVESKDTEESEIDEEGMVLTEEQMIKLETYFEKVEKDWSDRMNQLFVKELGLESRVLNEYWKMREGYEQDKLDAFEEFHEEMIEKYGENYTYKPSEEEQLFSAKVRERYDQALIKLLGEKAYERYIEERDQFNRELAEVDDKDLGFIKVDF